MLPKSFSNWDLPGVPWGTLTTTDAVSNTGYTVSLWPNGRVAYTTIQTFQRALSSSEPLSKRLSCYSINWSEIHTQMWHMLPLKSKEVHQALCIFFHASESRCRNLYFISERILQHDLNYWLLEISPMCKALVGALISYHMACALLIEVSRDMQLLAYQV